MHGCAVSKVKVLHHLRRIVMAFAVPVEFARRDVSPSVHIVRVRHFADFMDNANIAVHSDFRVFRLHDQITRTKLHLSNLDALLPFYGWIDKILELAVELVDGEQALVPERIQQNHILQTKFLHRFHIERAGGAENFFRCRPLNETECVSKSEVCARCV